MALYYTYKLYSHTYNALCTFTNTHMHTCSYIHTHLGLLLVCLYLLGDGDVGRAPLHSVSLASLRGAGGSVH